GRKGSSRSRGGEPQGGGHKCLPGGGGSGGMPHPPPAGGGGPCAAWWGGIAAKGRLLGKPPSVRPWACHLPVPGRIRSPQRRELFFRLAVELRAALLLGGGLELATGGVDVAPARSADGGGDAALEHDVGEQIGRAHV